MTTSAFKSRSYRADTDLSAIAELINLSQVAYGLEGRTSVTELREDWADPTFDSRQDLRLWQNAEGNLVAMAQLWRQPPDQAFISRLEFVIHPHVGDSALAPAILAWAEQRVTMLGQDLAVPIWLQSGCRDTVGQRRSLLLQLGFRPERSFWRLQRSLTAPLPKSPFPDGWQIRCVAATDAENWVAMFNQTFIDHWNHTPTTVEEFQHWVTRSDYDANLDLVVETAARQMVAFAYSEIDAARNERLGLQEGHICLLGTRRGYRRLGLARALLTESLRRLQLLGMTTATIGVDSQNPSGAVKLYQSLGFEHHRSSTVYSKLVR